MPELATATPKPMRTPAIERRMQRRAARSAALGRASARKRKQYGGSDFAAWKRAILHRDGYRCLVADEGCFRVATTAHHLKSVGSGGRNLMENGIAICAWCHARLDDGLIARETLYARLTELYGYRYE
jgi:5-methylcytosine-specific restriction endonuclease McrA